MIKAFFWRWQWWLIGSGGVLAKKSIFTLKKPFFHDNDNVNSNNNFGYQENKKNVFIRLSFCGKRKVEIMFNVSFKMFRIFIRFFLSLFLDL